MFQNIAAQIAFSDSFPYLVTVSGVTSIAVIFGWRWWKQKNTYKSLDSLPSPPRHWLLGNVPQILAAVKQKKYFQLLFDWSQQLGPMYVFWTGNPVLVLSKPKVIEDTIVNGMRDGSLVRSQRASKAWNDISGPILLGQNGTEWQWRRKAWNPEFSSSSLFKYVEIISQACEQVIDTLKETAPPKEVQVDPLFVELTMRVICCLVLGIPVDKKSTSHEGPPLEVLKVYEAMSVVGYRFLRVATGEKRWMKYLPTKNSRDYWAARRFLEEFITPRVDLALQMREQNKTELPQVSPLFQESMLVKIAAKEPKYNRETLIAETIELLIAGTDTTAHTLSFAVAELTLNQRVFQHAQAVVDQACQSRGGINTETLKELAYVRAIIKETLRLYSVASGSTSLEAQRDIVIEGKLIPRGTKVFWSMLAAGRDPEVYPQSEEFLPERWLDKSKESSLLPMIDFGSGYHRCLGEHLSMLEATVMLALLLRYFDWELVNGRSSVEQLQQNLLIYPSDRMPVRFRLRK
ncbi:MAG: cytochrome P450 [Brasilonema octagenarum HA4186-MV1]|jgi:unspecific monooxygenase|uniref:Cytochrome P450 n=1 Tax=Brasilonema octagenarum UFV-OR1 TaxID=417115 RepID=A0ABX1M951_9CYAN|nr:cytochrome P450 [Brasilonema octagenarum]MBW4629879.1 cytochrome P450 [Brasilonema octagenarum HA4186-MV1]NMF64315.1 cytochrome P450 [Brasilonema octagenarum UFV-OR1]